MNLCDKIKSLLVKKDDLNQYFAKYRSAKYIDEQNIILKNHLDNIAYFVGKNSLDEISIYIKLLIDAQNYKFALSTIEKNDDSSLPKFNQTFDRLIYILCEELSLYNTKIDFDSLEKT